MAQAQTLKSGGLRRHPLFKWGVAMILLIIAAVVALGWMPIVKTEGRESATQTAALRKTQISDLTKQLTRTGLSSEGTSVDVILASFDFFRATNRLAEARTLGADRFLVFVANETVHFGDLPHHFSPILRVDNTNVRIATRTEVLNDSVHHRTTVLVFEDIPQTALYQPHTIELLLGDVGNGQRNILEYYTPIDYPDSVEGPPPLSLSLLLTLGAGLLAAISPCLLQLTAFYLPTMAGVSVDKTSGSSRSKVLLTALLFVLGFTIPYTAGGALMGGMGQALAQSGLLSPTGALAIVSGLVMIVMAGVVAWRARAPIVCKIPMPTAVRSSRRLPLLETFVSGFAIASGCLACFGGAILGVLLVYTGLLGSPLLGGLSMFVFSLGIAVPFMLAALSLSWVLPLAQKLQRLTPAIGLISALVMLFFGLTMVTGNFHVVSGWLYRILPLN
ncbi:MAG: cytochrome c biogenesis protein CcdA [Thermoflexales bacterium]|nr:cytochrome c biogenesis protein CcdA [Thermoflexales bacterium]